MTLKATEEERRRSYLNEYQSWIKEDAFIRVAPSFLIKNANVIGLHNFYLRKDDGSLKALIFPWVIETLRANSS